MTLYITIQTMTVTTDIDFGYQKEKLDAVTRRVQVFMTETNKVGPEGKDLGDMAVMTL